MRQMTLIAACLTFPVSAQQNKAPECYCTDSTGGRVEMGEQICLSVGRRQFMALCAMSLNVPIWRDTGKTCVTG